MINDTKRTRHQFYQLMESSPIYTIIITLYWECLCYQHEILISAPRADDNAVMLRQSTTENPLKKTCFSYSVQYTRKCINFTHLNNKPIKLCMIYSKWKKNIIRNQSQRSRDHINEKVASWPLKPNRTTACRCSIQVMKEPADWGYHILQEKCVSKCWISFN